MKKFLIVLLSVLLVFTVFGCKNNGPTPAIDEEFEALMDKWFAEEMESDYLSMHFGVKDPAALGLKVPEVTLGDVEVSDEDIADVVSKYETLKNYDTSKLSEAQMMTYRTALSYYEIISAMYEFEDDYGFVFTPNSGVNNNLITNFQEFEIRSEQEAKDLIALVLDGERYIDDCIAYTKDQANDGVVQTKSTIEAVLEQLERFVSKVDDNELIKAFDVQIDELGYSADYKQQYKDAVVNHLIPAYKRVIAMYKDLYASAPETKAICDYDNGKEYYQVILNYKTSTTKSVDKIEEELEDAIYDTLSALFEVIETTDEDTDYGYTTPEAALEMLKSKMDNDFPAIPNVSYTVDFLDPSVTSENTAAYYLLAPVDDITKNVIKVNPAYGETDPNGLVITLSHEGYPGHLYQHTYFLSQNPNKIRNCLDFTAFAEGWAMYVEDWAYNTLEKSSDVGKLNSLYDQLMYYIYAYVDILFNYEGYDVEDVTNFLGYIFQEEYAAMLAESLEGTVVGDPGLFIPYGYGEYKMLDLKAQAEKLAGRNFNLKEFNTLILNTGDTSFDVLEQVVTEYYTNK